MSLEQKLERDFSIDYEGDKNEDVIKKLCENLTIIKETNPKLLEYLNKICVLTEKESIGLTYIGLANHEGKITLRCDYSLPTLAHELAHTKYNNSSLWHDAYFLSLFDTDLIVKGEGWRKTWEDGTRGPKKGYISPTAKKDLSENISRYIEKFYCQDDYQFWKERSKAEFNYESVLRYLWAEDFITEEQFNKAISAIK